MSSTVSADDGNRCGSQWAADDRLFVLDMLRGLALLFALLVFISRPVLEQLPPSSFRATVLAVICSPLWQGVSLASFLQPAFLVITGAAMFCSCRRRRLSGQSLRRIWGHAALRAVAVIALGVLLDGWRPSQDGIRFVGPLQQIGVCSLLATLIATLNEWKAEVLLLSMALANSWLLHDLVPLDERQPDRYVDNHNVAAVLDADWLPGRRFFGTWDQYGLASLLPATALTIGGLLLARYLVACGSKALESAGTVLLVGGLLVGESWILRDFVPMNEYLWTLPFVSLSMGAVLVAAALCQVICSCGYRGILATMMGLGRNALVVSIGIRLIGPDAWPLELFDGGIVADAPPLFIAAVQTSVLLVFAFWLSARGRFVRL